MVVCTALGVVIEGLDCEMGKGYSKKESQQKAAEATLKALETDKYLTRSIFEAKERRANEVEQQQTSGLQEESS